MKTQCLCAATLVLGLSAIAGAQTVHELSTASSVRVETTEDGNVSMRACNARFVPYVAFDGAPALVCQSLAVKHLADGQLNAEGYLDREKMVFTSADGKKMQQSASNEPDLPIQNRSPLVWPISSAPWPPSQRFGF